MKFIDFINSKLIQLSFFISFLLLNQLSFGQEIRINDSSFFQNKIFISGEIHGISSNQTSELATLKCLNSVINIKYYFFETSFDQICLLDQYLKYNDSVALNLLLDNSESQNYREVKEFYQALRLYYQSLTIEKRFIPLALDIVVDTSENYSKKYFSYLFKNFESGKYTEQYFWFREYMNNKITLKNFVHTSLKTMNTNFDRHDTLIKILHLYNNWIANSDKVFIDRDKYMADTFMNVFYGLDTAAKIYMQLGTGHIWPRIFNKSFIQILNLNKQFIGKTYPIYPHYFRCESAFYGRDFRNMGYFYKRRDYRNDLKANEPKFLILFNKEAGRVVHIKQPAFKPLF